MNINESARPEMPDEMPASGINAPKRAPDIRETVFAWVFVIIGYIFCRSFPISARPVGTLIFLIALYAAGGIFLFLTGAKQTPRSAFCILTVFLFSSSLFISSNEFIHFLSTSWALGCFMIWVMLSNGGGLEKKAGELLFYDAVKAVFVMPFVSFGRLFASLIPRRENGAPRVKIGRQIAFAALGILIAVIPTAMVTYLLSYNDDFNAMSSRVMQFISGDILGRAASLLFAVPLAAYVFGAFASGIDRRYDKHMTADRCRSFSASLKFAPETMACFAVLPLIAVYIIFFVSQWNYYVSAFFGRLPQDVDVYARYASDGFMQLCVVSGINAAIMLTVSVFTVRKRGDRHSIATRAVIGLLSVCTLVLVATAISKMVLYIKAYGLTRLRVYASWFMLLIAAGFIVMLLKQIFPKIKVSCTLLAVFVVFFGVLAVSDPDGIIANHNIDRYIDGTLEMPNANGIEYLVTECGDSAIPGIARLSHELEQRGTNEKTKKAADEALRRWLLDDAKERTRFYYGTLPKIKARIAASNAVKDS